MVQLRGSTHQSTRLIPQIMAKTDSRNLSQDEVFDLLSSPRRRYVINYLRRAGEPIQLTELAAEVSSWENETAVHELSDKQQKRVYVSLYQTHIPKLEEFGIVDYNPDEGTVSATDRIDDVGRYLPDEEAKTRWDIYYLVLAVASALIYATFALDLVTMGPGTEPIVAAAIMVAFLSVATVHWMAIKNGLRSVRPVRDRID